MTEQSDVRITQREVYDKVVSLEDGFGRVEALLEKHIALEEQRNEGVEVRLENHGTRLADQGSQIASLEARVTQGESDHRTLKDAFDKREAKKAPWWNVVGVIFGAIAIPGSLIALLVALSNLAAAITHAP